MCSRAHDTILAIAERLSVFLQAAEIPIADETIEALTIFYSRKSIRQGVERRKGGYACHSHGARGDGNRESRVGTRASSSSLTYALIFFHTMTTSVSNVDTPCNSRRIKRVSSRAYQFGKRVVFPNSNGQKTCISRWSGASDAVPASPRFPPHCVRASDTSPPALRHSARFCISAAVRCASNLSRRCMCSPTAYCC